MWEGEDLVKTSRGLEEWGNGSIYHNNICDYFEAIFNTLDKIRREVHLHENRMQEEPIDHVEIFWHIIFNIKVDWALVLIEWSASWANLIALCMYLWSRNPHLSWEIWADRIGFRRWLMTLATILYEQFQRDIGQQLLKSMGYSHFGMFAMNVELKGGWILPVINNSSTLVMRS